MLGKGFPLWRLIVALASAPQMGGDTLECIRADRSNAPSAMGVFVVVSPAREMQTQLLDELRDGHEAHSVARLFPQNRTFPIQRFLRYSNEQITMASASEVEIVSESEAKKIQRCVRFVQSDDPALISIDHQS